jgi:biopolymer transport protein ExbB/biopolymer transport protein TolQ
VATGVGLFVALPAVVAYNVIQKRIGEVETESIALTKLISAYLKAGHGNGGVAPAETPGTNTTSEERADSKGRLEVVGAA